ncbi:MAG: type II toxin-antitoxin system YafQ family toxin [Methylovulum sp.]|nr:type II toxin-antitoxin system YafQ family toxin [Methylovulum sp.]
MAASCKAIVSDCFYFYHRLHFGVECKHIKPNWLLIYQLTPDKVVLTRTGSHRELF